MAVAGLVCRSRLLCRIEIFKGLRYSTVINSVQLTKNVHVRKTRLCRKFTTNLVAEDKSKKEAKKASSSSDSEDSSDIDEDDVTIEYVRGLPQVTVPLPSRREKCRFTLRPISNTVGDFIDMLKNEDKGIDRVVIQTFEGIRIASSTTIETLLEDNFKLDINGIIYTVCSPKPEKITTEEIQRLGDIKNLVSQLYEVLNVKEHQVLKERVLHTELETLQQELLPLEETKGQLEIVAQRKSNWLAWAGLGLMSVQFGILARLTWWEYSWDIMEPVTYFVTYGTAMACYAYFVLTKQEYVLTDVKDREHLLTVHKKAKKLGFDVNKYNLIKEQIRRLEKDLKKIKDPKRLHLPPERTSTATQSPTDGLAAKNAKDTKQVL